MAHRRSSIRRIQYYHQNYCSLCITGCLGCRWKRYKQSKSPNTKCDIAWFVVLLTFTVLVSFWFYTTLILYNDQADINWFIFDALKSWFDWYSVILGVSATVIVYFILLNILALCHIGFRYEIVMHHLHRVLMVIFSAGTLALLAVITDISPSEWVLVSLSIHITGPFLHIGAVCIVTLLSWIIIGRWFAIRNKGLKIFWMVVLVVIMLFLYLCPLLVTSPCVCASHELPRKPKLVGHRGNAAFAPENTLSSFESAVEHGADVLETDVRFSLDNIPFLLHDYTFLRTTNVQDVYPERAQQPAHTFNMSDIKKLNAGSFFIKTNPFRTLNTLSSDEMDKYNNQSVPTLEEFLHYAKKTNKEVMFDIRTYTDRELHYKKLKEVIKTSAIPVKKILWLVDDRLPKFYNITGVTLVEKGDRGFHAIIRSGFNHVNTKYSSLSLQTVKALLERNISVNMFVVDSRWLFSLNWCLGTSSVATNYVNTFAEMTKPLWTISPNHYLIIWIIVDVISLVAIIIVLTVQRYHLLGNKFTIHENIDLQQPKSSSRTRPMKEKLIKTSDASDDGSGIVGIGIDADMNETQRKGSVQMLDAGALQRQDVATTTDVKIRIT